MPRTPLLLLIAIHAVAAAPPAGGAPRFVPIGSLGTGFSFWSEARSVSDDGRVVVGVSRVTGVTRHGFRWTASGGMQDLGDFAGGEDESFGLAVSGDGATVAGVGHNADGQEAFVWTASGGLVALGDLPGGNHISSGLGISGDGSTIVGSSWGEDGIEAVRWDDGSGPIGLGSLLLGPSGRAWDASTDGSVIVGSDRSRVGNQTGDEAFRWTAETGMVGLGDAPGGTCCSEAFGVSGDGATVVGRAWSGSGLLAMRWTEEEGIVLLGDLPGGESDSHANRASADGSTIIGVANTELGDEAFIWTAWAGMRNLQELAETDYGLDLGGWKLQEARDLSPDGSAIVGWGWNPDGDREGWLLVIPEPHTGLLVLAGLVGIAARTRR